LEGFADSEGDVLDFIVDETVDVAKTVVHAVMMDRLKAALPLLSDSEQALIQAIFFEELSVPLKVLFVTADYLGIS
jgi:DNA-directed RNA polymerase specialized sigma subunit